MLRHLGHLGLAPSLEKASAPCRAPRLTAQEQAVEPGFASRGKPARPRHRADSDRVLLYGLHAVEAALANPKARRPQAARHRECRAAARSGAERPRRHGGACHPEAARPAARRRRRASGRGARDGPLAAHRARRGEAQRHPRRARSGDRPAQCRRRVALRGGLRRRRPRHAGAAQPTAHRRAWPRPQAARSTSCR